MVVRPRSKKVRIASVVGILMAVLLPFTSVMPASASAYGCSWFGNFTIGGLPTPIYQGSYCVDINGGGTNVNYVAGYFSSAGNICNWNITAEFFTKANTWYKTYSTPVHSGCNRIANNSITIGSRMKEGYMCSTLKTNNKRITSVCHNIFK